MNSAQALAALGALAQESRLAVFRELVRAGRGGLAAGEIGDRLGVPAPTLSFHLAQLKHAGLATSRAQGRSRVYAADFDAMSALVAYLSENCCSAPSCSAPSRSAPSCAPKERSVPRRARNARRAG